MMLNILTLDIAIGPMIAIAGFIIIIVILVVTLIIIFAIKVIKKIKKEEENDLE